MKTKYELIIFDCDGVMFDTRWVNRLYYNHMLAHFNLPEMTDEQFEYSHSHSAIDAVRYLCGPHNIPEQDIINYLKNINYAKYISHMIINPELKPLIKAIRPPCKTAIATNRSDTMPKVMERFELKPFFDRVMTALDVEHPKPDPEMIVNIIKHFKIEPDRVFYIGDTQVDEQAAINAKITFAAFQDKTLKADFHIDSLSEIESIISA
ncbi:haloacid dehalogenase [Candidatus Magnetomorum sp. HK-1]|nr:haloacid dehalogenase [Candidatus Magnetomorum sp. HK-1]